MSEKTTMLTYIKETPSQVCTNVKNRKELVKDLVNTYLEKEYRTVWIVACGSSNNGSQCAKPFMMEYLNCDVKITTPNSFIYGDNKCKEDDLVMVISQSGCSTNSIAALKKCRELGVKAIGLTGNVNSDFKDVSDLLIDWGVGTETVGYVTKGVTTLALFLMLFALEAGLAKKTISMEKYNAVVEELEKCPSYHETIQKETYSFLEKNIKALTSIRTVYSCGFKQGYGICTEAALKIGETVKVPSFAYEAEEYIHGPNLQITPDYTFFLVDDFAEGSDRLVQIYQATRSVSDETYCITNSPVVDDDHAIRVPFEVKEPLLMPLYILPVFQIIAYEVSAKLNSWDNHPMFKDFKKYADSKTATVKKIMFD